MRYAVPLSLALGGVIVLSTVAAGQHGQSSTPLGVEGIKSVLTSHPRWTLYWDRGDMARPRFGAKTTDRSKSVILEFMRLGSRLIVHSEGGSLFAAECVADVTVTEHAFTIQPCWGLELRLIYDPEDGEYPFKGRNAGTLLWLAPSR